MGNEVKFGEETGMDVTGLMQDLEDHKKTAKQKYEHDQLLTEEKVRYLHSLTVFLSGEVRAWLTGLLEKQNELRHRGAANQEHDEGTDTDHIRDYVPIDSGRVQ
ncbi:hypothetical protein SK128_006933 [Halocaridina rubra]|uniref:Uncharacterized protein n=1 Tax=Halocaridina rubra TaxID=373956 RepID=A0AAN9AHG4_HALRR